MNDFVDKIESLSDNPNEIAPMIIDEICRVKWSNKWRDDSSLYYK